MYEKINSITMLSNGEYLCEVIYYHDNGDIFKDYTTYNKEELLSLISYNDVQVICEYMDKEELETLNNNLFLNNNNKEQKNKGIKISRLRLTKGNKKVKALLFSLPPITSCLNNKSCASTCYATKSYKQYPSVRNLWDDNYRLATTNLFQLYDDIDKQLSKCKDGTIVRIHQSGDFISQEYINMWVDLISKYNNIIFYGYTKVDKILDITVLDKLINCNIIRSMYDNNRNYGSVSYVHNMASKYDGIVCPATYGPNKDDIKCGVSCFKCMEKDTKVFFVQH